MSSERIQAFQARAEQALEARLPAAGTLPCRLHEAMRYATLGGGKRVRPVLVYAAGEAVGVPAEALDAPACAVEFIHAYSLVHDDLPAMDDDDLRRGQPTCHRAFDEATAILAGDALQTLAFQVLATDTAAQVDAARRLRMVELLARASGSRGMAGGQAIDMGAVGRELSLAELENMHIHKTGALIRASVLLGALCQPQVADADLDRLDHYAKCIGLAFQIRDDILDVVGDTATIGKTQGADLALNKPTYPSLLGLDGAREHARALYEAALASLEPLGARADTLRTIATWIVDRAR
ncbi:farnesyl-diphosphate synthase [Plasticicumulans lactativorans]|uniref:Farnesyl-diphosphate synthase n=1 Tax=Plasticicumulans lactativorans TaxID=1133106 RepID=A0A4R2LCJ5_9GAMM|nr:farnesyl diphosphate synthase [Plasticicumulans lactativorans]TCO82082.1 farnesyl-diphosphate synthase [Plasticicumulans lactativorans]